MKKESLELSGNKLNTPILDDIEALSKRISGIAINISNRADDIVPSIDKLKKEFTTFIPGDDYEYFVDLKFILANVEKRLNTLYNKVRKSENNVKKYSE